MNDLDRDHPAPGSNPDVRVDLSPRLAAVRAMIPARSRISHLKVLLDTITASQLGGETEIGPVIRNLVPRLKRRGLVVVLSDCFGDVGALMKSLAHLRHKGHEVIVFQLWDRDELEFPFKQWTKFINLEALDELAASTGSRPSSTTRVSTRGSGAAATNGRFSRPAALRISSMRLRTASTAFMAP